jgi:hypothetical protein
MKIGIVGLIGLFAWNALLGAFGGIFLCIHQDHAGHAEAEIATEASCSSEHCAPNETDTCIDSGECCIDIELRAEQLPVARLKSDANSVAPLVLLAVLIDYLRAPEPSLSLVYESPESCSVKQN